MKGKNLLGRVSRGLLKRGVVFTSMTRHIKSVVTLSTFFLFKIFFTGSNVTSKKTNKYKNWIIL